MNTGLLMPATTFIYYFKKFVFMSKFFSRKKLAKFKPYYLYRFLKWKLGDRSPLGVSMKVTSRCPLECKHCPWFNSETEDLPTERWFSLIDEAIGIGCTFALFEGGEPTMREDLGSLIDYAKSKGLYTLIFTNGWNPLDEYYPDVFWISVDEIGEMHDDIRRKGSFERLVNHIERLDRDKIITWTTIHRQNIGRLEELCEFLSRRVAGMMFSFFYPYEGVDDLSLSADERVRVGQRLLELKSEYNIMNSDAFLSRLDEPYKVYPWMHLNISPEGYIHHGCPVEQAQSSYDCSVCFSVCCREPSLAYNLNISTLRMLSMITRSEDSLLWL